MAWVAVTKQGREFISMCKPTRVTDEDNYYGWKDTFTEISLCSGSIKKLIGRDLSWNDEPVELKEEQLMFEFYIILTLAFLYIAFMGGVIGYLIGKYWKKKQCMKIRQAKKILNMMARGTDTRYFDSKYKFKKESRFIPRLKNLYQKATIRWNKVNLPSANVSLFRSILRTSKECSRCKHFNGMFSGKCNKLHKYVESSDWCHGTFFHRK